MLVCLGPTLGLAMTVEDPKNVGGDLQRLFPVITATPFTCQGSVQFLQNLSRCDILCDQQYCKSQCDDSIVRAFAMQAENCDQAEINIHAGIPWSLKVLSTPNLIFGQTWIQEFLESTDFFIVPSGAYELIFAMPPTKRILVDEYGDEKEIAVVSIYLDYKQTPTSPKIQIQLILDLNARGLEQILYFGFTQDDKYFIKRKGFL